MCLIQNLIDNTLTLTFQDGGNIPEYKNTVNNQVLEQRNKANSTNA